MLLMTKGQRCEQQINVCSLLNPCQYGNCYNGAPGQYICLCYNGIFMDLQTFYLSLESKISS